MFSSRSLLAAALLVFPGILAAQLRGTVHELGASAPLPGAVITAVDSAGTNAGRAIADARGRFAIAVPIHADHLHVVRIGFRPRDVSVPAKLDTELEIAMERIPPMLEAVKVSDKELCPGSVERGAAFALWEQARDGLLAAVVARELNPAIVRMLTFDRRLDARDELIREQHTSTQTGSAKRPFQAAAGASYFAKVGYMADDGAAGRVYSAPDADVLLDPAFAATHCFRLQRADREHEGQIGLAFVPAPGRDTLVDVAGVIWLDQTTPQLRTFEFRYTSLEPPAEQMHAGGHLEFRTMPNGISFIEHWWLRLPIMTTIAGRNSYRPYQRGPVRRQDRDDLTLLGMTEAGGTVLDAQWPDGQRWRAPRTIVSGEVLQRKSPLPAAHVVVSLAGTADSATTDSTGHFELKVLPGRYTVIAADTLLRDFVATRSESRVVTAERDRTTNVRLEVDRMADVIADVCHSQDVDDKRAIVVGHVSVLGGALPRESRVVADWQDDYILSSTLAQLAIQGKRQDATIDDKGRFVVCGVVRERPIHLRLYVGLADVVADTTFKIHDTPLTFVLPWHLNGNIVSGGATLAGTVLGTDQRPVPGATVLLSQLQRSAVTDTAGRFQLAALRPGTYSVELHRIGYTPLVDSVTLPPRTQVVRGFTLRSGTTLDTVRAVAGGMHYHSPNLREFEERSRTGQGTFIVDSVLRRNESHRVSEVLRSLVPGLAIQSSGAVSHVVSARDARSGKHAFDVSTGIDHCYATVYLDGLLLFDFENYDPASNPPPNIDDFRLSDLTGVEYHPGQAALPPKFKSSECGTLLLWTREK